MNIRDIAKAANVSAATVSKIINHKDAEISETTRQKVLKVIREYQYTPYANIKMSIDTENSRLLAFVFQEDIFSQETVLKLGQAVAHAGYSLVIYAVEEPAIHELRRTMKIIAGRKIDGIILGVSDPALLEEIASQNYNHVPVVALSMFRSDLCTTFHIDYSRISEKAILTFLQHGHKRIGCVVSDNGYALADDCINGCKKAGLLYSNYGFEESLIYSFDGAVGELIKEIRKWLQFHVTAVFCQSRMLARVVYEVLKGENVKIPRDVSVICGEGTSQTDYYSPELTTCDYSYEEILPQLVEYLLKQIEMNDSRAARSFSFDPILHNGESAAPYRHYGKQILVIGNCSTDYTLQIDHMPVSNEFLTTGNMTSIPGGKAVVQAIGAGKLNGNVYILGCVGNDTEGQSIISALKETNVHTEGLTVLSSLPTGRAYILSVPENESTIISYPGANSAYTVSHMWPYHDLFRSSDFCLLSTELDEKIIRFVVKCCEQYHTELFLKPSSLQQFPEELYDKVSYIIPNRTELDFLVPDELPYEEKAEILFQKGCKNVIVTLGKNGCYLKNEKYAMTIPPAYFHHSDSTGAANCFIAALAVSLSEDQPLLYAICCATYAAGVSITQPGVQTSFPDRKQMEIYLDDIQEMFRSLG